MKNQLCKPCDYRRAFRLRQTFNFKPVRIKSLLGRTCKACNASNAYKFFQLQITKYGTIGVRWRKLFVKTRLFPPSAFWYYRIFRL